MNKKVVYFLCQQFSGLDNFIIGNADYPQGMPAVWKTWLAYVERGYDVHVFMIGEFKSSYTKRWNNCYIHIIKRTRDVGILKRVVGNRLGNLLVIIFDNISLYKNACATAHINKPVIIYALRPYNCYASWFLSKKYKALSVKRIFGTLLHSKLLLESNKLKKLLQIPEICHWLWPSDLMIITNDGTCGDRVAELLRIKKNKYIFWYNGIDKEWTINDDEINILKKEMNLNSKDFILLSLSSLQPWKRQDRIIKAVNIATKEIPQLKLIVVGDGPTREHLMKMVKYLNIEKYVNFVGMIKHNKVRNMMCIADVFLQTNDYSCLGNSLIEAMICGRPIITWDVGSTKEVIIDGLTGCLLPDAEPATIANRIIYLYNNPEESKKLGKEARKFIENNFQTWNKRLDNEIETIESLYLKKYREPA